MVAPVLRRLAAVALCLPLVFVPDSAPAGGDPEAFALLSRRSGHELVVRWNPCEPIDYRVNLARAPRGAMVEVRIAVDRVAKATGLTFEYAGETDVVPGEDPGNYPPDTDLIIAWGDVEKAGIGGATYTPGLTASGEDALIIDHGVVLLDATGETTVPLLMHELGHAVGLAHPLLDDPREIMYSQLTDQPAAWGAGDLAGLRAVGADGGCLHYDEARDG